MSTNCNCNDTKGSAQGVQKKYAHLADISSLKELRRAIKSVGRDIRRREKSMKTDYYEALRTYSLKSVLCAAFDRLDNAQAYLRYAMKGYNVSSGILSSLSGLFGGRKRRSGGCGG
jgi:hypothetical protein